jgi:hypothetical protein
MVGIARKQVARTTTARHRSSRRARAMLSAIYNWFPEDFDTADLKDLSTPE